MAIYNIGHIHGNYNPDIKGDYIQINKPSEDTEKIEFDNKDGDHVEINVDNEDGSFNFFKFRKG